MGALDGVFPTRDSVGVAAGDNHEIRVGARIQSSLNLLHRFFLWDDLLAGEEAALLGEHLILDMHAGHARCFVLANGALDVQGVAIAGVCVADDGDVHRSGDIFGVGDHFSHGQQANVGKPQLSGGARPGHVNGLEPHRLGNLGMECVKNEGRNGQAVGIYHLA